MHRHDVRVALDHDRLVVRCDGLLGQIDPEQHLRLLVEQCLGGVHVLAEVVVLEEFARTEPDDVARHGTDRPQETTVEPVDRPPVAHPAQAGVLELLELETTTQEVLGQGVPPGGGITAPERVDDLAFEPPVTEKRPRRLCTGVLRVA
jgi:hypothetical protein